MICTSEQSSPNIHPTLVKYSLLAVHSLVPVVGPPFLSALRPIHGCCTTSLPWLCPYLRGLEP